MAKNSPDKPDKPDKLGKPEPSGRDARLARALRANLRRRKDQARQRATIMIIDDASKKDEADKG